jgi:hypothetical protein
MVWSLQGKSKHPHAGIYFAEQGCRVMEFVDGSSLNSFEIFFSILLSITNDHATSTTVAAVHRPLPCATKVPSSNYIHLSQQTTSASSASVWIFRPAIFRHKDMEKGRICRASESSESEGPG